MPDTASASAAEAARARAQEAVTHLRERAEGLAGGAREQLDHGTTAAGERVAGTATPLREMSEALRDRGQDGPARIAEAAAERSERLGGYLKEPHPDRLVQDLGGVARRRWWIPAASAAAIGLVAARLLRGA